VLYRLYSPEDFEPLFAIEEACFEPPFRFDCRYMRELVRRSDSATWIAEEDGQMAGFGIVVWMEQADGVSAYIETIEVARAWRGRGVAGELMRRIEGSARTGGAEVIWLHVDGENVSAIRLYAAHGYLCEGREENFYPQGRAALVYAKPLTAEAES
jgi:ribosomal protein S18 acetylase RimI-like enzyme